MTFHIANQTNSVSGPITGLEADRISGPVRYPVDFDPIRSGPVLPLKFTGLPDQENENFQFQTLKFSVLKLSNSAEEFVEQLMLLTRPMGAKKSNHVIWQLHSVT